MQKYKKKYIAHDIFFFFDRVGLFTDDTQTNSNSMRHN